MYSVLVANISFLIPFSWMLPPATHNDNGRITKLGENVFVITANDLFEDLRISKDYRRVQP